MVLLVFKQGLSAALALAARLLLTIGSNILQTAY
jgi:hypothetical protein